LEKLHRLLKRQFTRYFGKTNPLPKECPDFVAAVNEAYWQFDADRAMLEHSLDLSSQELIQANSEMRAIFGRIINNSGDGILAFDRECRCTVWNPGMERITGVGMDKALGQSVFEAFPLFKEKGEDQLLTETLDGKTIVVKDLAYTIPKTSQQGSFEGHFSPVRNESGDIIGGSAIIYDVTERKHAEKMIHHMAYYDTLTSFPNRNMLYDRLLNAIRTDNGESKPLALLLMDLDRFHEINTTLGHQHGDILLQEVGWRLKNTLFESDFLARMGGDEFAILLPRLRDVGDIKGIVQKIFKTLETPFVIEGLPIAVEASLGIALYPDHGENANQLMQHADVAMHIAKETGSGYCTYTTETDQHSPRRLSLLGQLRHAIEQEHLVLHYQPKIDFHTGSVAGAEALVRWHHPELGMIPPNQFIGPAEQTGLIKPLTTWILDTALNQCYTCHQAGITMSLAVNLSRRSLYDSHLPDLVAELLKNSGIQPQRLVLEITESAIMSDPARAIEILTRLRQMEVRLSIDDFGTGYSSLASLKKLPIDELKIDQAFIKEMATNDQDARIVRSTIDLAHGLGLKVVAEGVEDQVTYNRLAMFECDSAQGYYMSRPLPIEEFKRWIRESPWRLRPREPE